MGGAAGHETTSVQCTKSGRVIVQVIGSNLPASGSVAGEEVRQPFAHAVMRPTVNCIFVVLNAHIRARVKSVVFQSLDISSVMVHAIETPDIPT